MRRKKDLIIFVDGTARHTDEPMHLLFVDDRKFNLDESDVWNCWVEEPCWSGLHILAYGPGLLTILHCIKNFDVYVFCFLSLLFLVIR